MLVYNTPENITAHAELLLTSKKFGVTDRLALASDDTLTIKVRVPRVFLAEKATLRLYRDSDMTRTAHRARLIAFGDSCDDFEVKLELSKLGVGLYYLDFMLDGSLGRSYVCKDGTVTANEFAVDSLQLSVISPDFTTPDRFEGSMIYQIFPDRFARSGRVKRLPEGRKFNPDWKDGIPQFAERPGGEVANDEFFGGDLWGVAERLDYIRSLGVDTLYLCPIFRAASNHRYDTADYMEVDPLLGGNPALVHLIAELKKRGMKLILDGVFNHTGADSRYFNKFWNYPGSGAYHSRRSKYYSWYSFDEYPDEYKCWWGVKILPAVKSEEPSYREFICGEDGVLRKYLKMGIDGWRLDVADELSDVFLDELRNAVKSENSDAIVLGEVWEDASNKVAYDRRRRYFLGDQLDSVMNYPLKEAVIDFILSGDSTKLVSTATTLRRHYPRSVSRLLMNFLGTHDTERILTVLANVGTSEMTNAELSTYKLAPEKRRIAIERLKLAWALLCAFPGLPCIYYGDESGMEGGRDPFNRLPFVPERADHELTHFFRRVGEIRRTESAFARGNLEFAETGDPGQLVIIREDEDVKLVIAVNLTDRPITLEFERAPERLLGEVRVGRLREGRECEVAPMSVEYFKLKLV